MPSKVLVGDLGAIGGLLWQGPSAGLKRVQTLFKHGLPTDLKLRVQYASEVSLPCPLLQPTVHLAQSGV